MTVNSESTMFDCPVDVVWPDLGARVRRLPGRVNLTTRECQTLQALPIALGEVVARSSASRGAWAVVKVLAAPFAASQEDATADNPSGLTPTRPCHFDVALGPHYEVVAFGLPGWRCSATERIRSTRADAALDEIMRALKSGELSARPYRLEPSLLYETPGHPTSVQIEVSTRCNLSCGYCSHSRLPKKQDVSLYAFERALDQIEWAYCQNVDLTGLGEALLHPKLSDFIAAIRARGAAGSIQVVSNGVAMTSRRVAALVRAGLTDISVSLDSLEPEVFARHRGGSLSRVQGNLEALIATRTAEGWSGLGIHIKSVLVDDPLATAVRLMDYAHRLGLAKPHFMRLDGRASAVDGYDDTWADAQSDGAARPGLADDGVWRALQTDIDTYWRGLSKKGARVDAPSPADQASPASIASEPPVEIQSRVLSDDLDLCGWAREKAMIAIDGDALSCCETMIDLPRRHFGGLREMSMRELWGGPLFWGVRLPLSLGLAPSGCVGCAQAPAGARPLSQ